MIFNNNFIKYTDNYINIRIRFNLKNMVVWFPEDLNYLEMATLDIKKNRCILMILRSVSFVVMSCLFFQQICRNNPFDRALGFFTYWGICISWACFTFLFISTLISYKKNTIILLFKITHIMFETAWTIQLLITIFFWGVLMPVNHGWIYTSPDYRKLMTVCEHAFAIIILFADLSINNMKFHIPHLIFPAIIGLCYMIMGICLSWTIGFVAYPILTWKDFLSVGCSIAVMALMVGSFFVGYYSWRLKCRIYGITENMSENNAQNQDHEVLAEKLVIK